MTGVAGLREQLLVIAGAAASGNFINWRVKRRGGRFDSRFCTVAEMDRLIPLIATAGATSTVFLACAPRARRDGGKDAVERVECLWADCDSDPSLEVVERFTPSPSLIVASGGLTDGGRRKLHLYWRLAAHVDTDTGDVALRRLQGHFGPDPQCAEAARVLRPIGTTWRKDGLVRPVEPLQVDLSTVYPIEDVLASTEPLPTPAQTVRPACVRHRARGGDLDALEAALKAIPPPVYVTALTGREPNRAGKLQCPFHDDWNPSFHVYPTADRGWACFQCDNGNGHVAGGSIVDLGARLYGMDPRSEYPALLRRLGHELLGSES